MAMASTNSSSSVRSHEASLEKPETYPYEKIEAVQSEKDLRMAISESYGLPLHYNFWEPEAYRQSYVRRFDTGRTCAEAIANLLVDRAALEKQVSDCYRKWAKSASQLINGCVLYA